MAVSSAGRIRAASVFCFSLVIFYVSRHIWLTPISNVYKSKISARDESPPSEFEEAIADERGSKKVFRHTTEMEEAVAEEHRFRKVPDGFEEPNQVHEVAGRDEAETGTSLSRNEEDKQAEVSKKIEEEDFNDEKEEPVGGMTSVDRQYISGKSGYRRESTRKRGHTANHGSFISNSVREKEDDRNQLLNKAQSNDRGWGGSNRRRHVHTEIGKDEDWVSGDTYWEEHGKDEHWRRIARESTQRAKLQRLRLGFRSRTKNRWGKNNFWRPQKGTFQKLKRLNRRRRKNGKLEPKKLMKQFYLSNKSAKYNAKNHYRSIVHRNKHLPYECSCKVVRSKFSGGCYFYTDRPAGVCARRQCAPTYSCVGRKSTGVMCVRRRKRWRIIHTAWNRCKTKDIHEYMYVPYMYRDEK